MSKNNIEFVTLKKENIKDFSEERNRLLKKAKSEWVFFIDSDEKLSAQLKKELEIRDLNNYDGFYVFRKNYFLGEYSGTDRIVRLGKRNKGFWKRAVHETWDINGKIGTLNGYLIHNTAQSVAEMVFKINQYSLLHAKEHIKEKKRFSICKLIFFPIGKFLQSIFIGRGLTLSMLQSLHSFLSWGKQWELQKE